MLKVFFYVYLTHYETESEINVLRCTMLFILAVVGGASNTEAGGNSAYNNVQVGVGPQHREKLFPLEIITSTQVFLFKYTLAEANVKNHYIINH
ncbi:hypothetical protein QP71_09420 [Staphylococcus aureus]|nr:hypothetical protein QP71_09420 [Staphylococcus aureus]